MFSGTPLTFRQHLNDDIEVLKLVEIIDKVGNTVPKIFIILQVQSMSEIDNFWLDSGLFSLSLNNSKN